MRKINALYEAEDDRSILDQNGVWPSKPIVQRAAETIPQSAYQEHLDAGLDPPPLSASSVRYWSDYSRVYYHPKSIVQLSEFDVNDKLMPFESWDVGMELFEKLEREVDLVDRDLRPFVEECDGIQGLQIFTGVDDAWGGWTSGWLERLRDEYGKLSIWTWGLGDHGANTTTPRVGHCSTSQYSELLKHFRKNVCNKSQIQHDRSTCLASSHQYMCQCRIVPPNYRVTCQLTPRRPGTLQLCKSSVWRA